MGGGGFGVGPLSLAHGAHEKMGGWVTVQAAMHYRGVVTAGPSHGASTTVAEGGGGGGRGFGAIPAELCFLPVLVL
jgi:hypothetical protein